MNYSSQAVVKARKLASKLIGWLPFAEPEVTVYCYHAIGKSSYYHFVDQEAFNRQIDHLMKTRLPITFDDLMAYVDGRMRFPKPAFLITFDDGYKSVMAVKGKLEENGIKPVMFVLSSPGNARRDEMDNDLEIMGDEDVRSLAAAGWEIGSHSATHQNLPELDDHALQAEVHGSRSDLERKFGKTIRAFSYPRSKFDDRVREAVKSAGYEAAFSLDDEALAPNHTDRWGIPRIGVNHTHGIEEFMVLPSWPMRFLRRLFRTILID